jgi:hypothetical protein
MDVPHDPELYFHGEEINITVRAFTHGYDLFHPHRTVVWHEYSRESRRKHWDDHPDWYLSNTRSHRRLRKFLGMEGAEEPEHFGRFALGTSRTLQDYERYAGICFDLRGVQQYTLDDLPPPNPIGPTNDQAWRRSFCTLQHYTAHLGRAEFPDAQDCNFWFVGAHDGRAREIHRQDISEEEIRQIDRSQDWVKPVEFLSESTPVSWTVWPHSKSQGWLQKITKPV